jgi:hypothetical protein
LSAKEKLLVTDWNNSLIVASLPMQEEVCKQHHGVKTTKNYNYSFLLIGKQWGVKRLLKFLHLSSIERGLLAKAAVLLCAMRLSVCLLPFRTLQFFVSRAKRSSIRRCKTDRISLDQITWAVTVASRYLPGKTSCLSKALAAQILLARAGYSTQMQVGIARGDEGKLKGHAWVEFQGKILFGDDGSSYTLIPALRG